ncbi:MAG TPA: alpha/beta hydrolase [Gemmatimonadaceae bacterium]
MNPPRRPLRFADGDAFRVPVGPGALHAERYGFGGDDVVLLHGFGTTSFLWRHVAPRLATWGMTAHVFDLLGYGASDRPVGAAWDVRSQATYLAQALRRLHVAGATIVGTDVGAAVALCLALAHPDRASRLVLISPPPLRGTLGPDVRHMQRESARHVTQMVRGLFGVRPLLETLLRGALSDPERLDPRLLGRYMAPYVGREGVTHFLALANAVEEDDLSDLPLAALRHPALVLYGERDHWCPAAHAAEVAQALPWTTTECIGGAGRLLAEEAPEALAERLRTYVRSGVLPRPTPRIVPRIIEGL